MEALVLCVHVCHSYLLSQSWATKKQNCTICTMFFLTQVQEHPKDLIYTDTKCIIMKCIKQSGVLQLHDSSVEALLSFPNSHVHDGPILCMGNWTARGRTAGNSLFLFLGLAHRNVASKGYFGNISVLYVMLYLHTIHVLVRYTPRLIHAVGHTECPPKWVEGPFIEVNHDFREHNLQTHGQKSPLIWTPWLSYRTRQKSRTSSLFDANMGTFRYSWFNSMYGIHYYTLFNQEFPKGPQ